MEELPRARRARKQPRLPSCYAVAQVEDQLREPASRTGRPGKNQRRGKLHLSANGRLPRPPANQSHCYGMAVAPPKAEAVAQATVPPPKGPGDAAKEQGNAHFKAKEYLKAAAS